MEDAVLLGVLTGLLLVAAILKIQLKKRQGTPYAAPWMVQLFVFPLLCLIALGAYLLGRKNFVIQVILIGILEEILCWGIRKRTK